MFTSRSTLLLLLMPPTPPSLRAPSNMARNSTSPASSFPFPSFDAADAADAAGSRKSSCVGRRLLLLVERARSVESRRDSSAARNASPC